MLGTRKALQHASPPHERAEERPISGRPLHQASKCKNAGENLLHLLMPELPGAAPLPPAFPPAPPTAGPTGGLCTCSWGSEGACEGVA